MVETDEPSYDEEEAQGLLKADVSFSRSKHSADDGEVELGERDSGASTASSAHGARPERIGAAEGNASLDGPHQLRVPSAQEKAIMDREKAAKMRPLYKVWEKIKLPVYTCLWYFFNIQYNLVNKQVLGFFPATWALSWWQLAAGIPIAMVMWGTGILKKPKLTKDDLVTLAPIGAAHSAGQILTVASLGAVAVSFTHTVKALEPGVNAIASGLLLGQVFHPMVYASLLPVFAGVAMASAGEMSFTMFGFLTAFGSNFAFVLRNVLSTKFGDVGDMGEDKVTRKTNQLAVLTTVAALVLLPCVAFIPGGLTSVPAAWKSAMATGIAPTKAASMIALSGFHFFMYQMSSFWVLSCVQPITHSVLNTLKRIVIIIVSVIVFRNPVSWLSAAGTLTAIGGVLLYSLTKAHYAKQGK